MEIDCSTKARLRMMCSLFNGNRTKRMHIYESTVVKGVEVLYLNVNWNTYI